MINRRSTNNHLLQKEPSVSTDVDIIEHSRLLSIKNLQTCFKTEKNTISALNSISFSINRAETVALVGESGSGKSLTALSIMQLVPPPGFISSGEIWFEGKNLPLLPEKEICSIRGSKISMIFQDPMTSLNPVLRVSEQISEPLCLHRKMSKSEASEYTVELLRKVGIQSAAERMYSYPHQLSGGMRQRVMIAMALACNPALLIADEPTTALDVTIQAQILELIDSLRKASEMGILLITHDLGIVAERSDKTCVMYAGRILESGATPEVLGNPRHPYTIALIAALPQNGEPGKPLATMSGQPPTIGEQSVGCGFSERCPEVLPICRRQLPELKEVSDQHYLRCWKYQ